MYEKQMELFGDGGLYEEGGMVDEVSGNEVPPGSTRKEVRDDIPAMLSEGEFVFPADVVRYFGLEKLMEMRQEAKMGMKKMEAMGQMGNSDEATIPDDLPFNVEDLIVVDTQEFAEGGIVQAQEGVFVQPPADQINMSTTSAPMTAAPAATPAMPAAQGTPTGYLPTFVNQTPTVTSGSNTPTSPAVDENFVPTVNDVYNFQTYRNTDTGEIREFPFYMGQPVIPIPEGFVPYTPEEETTETEDVTVAETTNTLQEQGDRDSGGVGVDISQNNTATPVSELSNESLQSALSNGRLTANAVNVIGSMVNPALGSLVGAAAVARYNDVLEEAQRRGLDTGGRERMGSIFGGEESLYSGLQDMNDDGKVTFADTWMGDLLGLDGKAGVQGPNLGDSRRGARRGATTTSVTSGGRNRGASTAATSPSSNATNTATSVSTPTVTTTSLEPSFISDVRSALDAIDSGGGGRGAGSSSSSSGGRGAGSSSSSSGGRGGSTASSSGTNYSGMSSADVAAAQEAGKGYSGGYGFKSGGLATRKQKTEKRKSDSSRGVAARKKK